MRTQDAETAALTPLLVVLGPTASGKTSLAVSLAHALDGEVLSADSRQVYKGMDLGSGKDIEEYQVNGQKVPYHLIDVAEAGEEYNIFHYQRAFDKAYADICQRGKTPVLCGGSGLYLAAVLGNRNFQDIPFDADLRKELDTCTLEELAQRLATYGPLHNHTDTVTRERCIKAIEIAEYERRNPVPPRRIPKPLLIGIWFEPEDLRQRIGIRLEERLQAGMVDEVRKLLESGLKPEQLIYYGLEYKFLTRHVIGELSFEDMKTQLYFAICQFAKRQRTWFRKMERDGYEIRWIDGKKSLDEKMTEVIRIWNTLF